MNDGSFDAVATFYLQANNQGGSYRVEAAHPAVRAALVDRTTLETSTPEWLANDWAEPGVYVLIGPTEQYPEYNFAVYVGSASTRPVADRVREHLKTDWWFRALLITSNRRAPWDSGEALWLESALIDLVQTAGVTARNKQRSNSQLAGSHSKPLEPVLKFIMTMLAVLGVVTPDSPAEVVEEVPEPASLTVTTTVLQPLSWVEAATLVLLDHDDPMHVRDIVNEVRDRQLRDLSAARTPEATLRRDLSQAASSGRTVRPGTRIEQTGPATFTLVTEMQPS